MSDRFAELHNVIMPTQISQISRERFCAFNVSIAKLYEQISKLLQKFKKMSI